MSKVIDGADRFEMKSLLDGASKNLTTIADSLNTAQSVIHDLPDKACALVELFAQGSIKPFYYSLEDSSVLYDLMDTQSDRYGQLMSITLRYSHQSCHLLTLALAQALPLPGLQVLKVVDQAGAPLHSGLTMTGSSLFLDANGVHTQEDVLADWVRRCGGRAFYKLTTAEQLAGLGHFKETDLRQALGEFGFTAAFMIDHLEALAQIPEFDLDDDLEEEDLGL